MLKRCSECGKKKKLGLFYRDIQKSDGLTSNCRDCRRRRHIKFYEKNKEKIKQYHKHYYSKFNEKIKELNRLRYVKVNKELFELLNSKCNRCGGEDKRVLQVDHISGGGHRERKIKGSSYTFYQEMIDKIKKGSKEYQLLCSNCNIIEGIEKGYKKSIWT